MATENAPVGILVGKFGFSMLTSVYTSKTNSIDLFQSNIYITFGLIIFVTKNYPDNIVSVANILESGSQPNAWQLFVLLKIVKSCSKYLKTSKFIKNKKCSPF